MARVSRLHERVIESFIELPDWPTSSKTAFASAVAFVIQVPVALLVLLQASRIPHLVDGALITQLLATWTATLVFILLVSALVARLGHEARWTSYLLIIGYGIFILLLISVAGTVTTPLVAFGPVTVATITLFFDSRAGVVALLFLVVGLALLAMLELQGVVPYAAALRARSIDNLRELPWYLIMLTAVGANLVYTFVLVRLSASAREAQQRKLAEAHANLAESRDRLAQVNEIISRYVASQVARQIIEGNYEAVDRLTRRKLTLFFSDIKDFAETADRTEPEDLANALNEYLSEMATIGERYGGTIDKFVGDAIMIFFGAPQVTDDQDQALRAVRMAVEMQARISELGKKWVRDGFERPFEVRIGINTGQASVGNFGSRGRMDYTAIGRQVNLAARLQSHCPPGKILLSHSTWTLVRDEVETLDKGEIAVKGFQNPVQVHEVVGLRPSSAVD